MEKSKRVTKKSILTTILVMGCLVFAVTFVYKKTSKDNDTKVSAAAEKYNDSEVITPASSGNVIYMNNYELGLSFSLPASWDGLYTCDQSEKGCMKFYHTPTHSKNGKGFLFSLHTDSTSVLKEKNNPYSSLDNFKILDSFGDTSVFVTYPSNVDSTVGNSKQEYQKMLSEVKKVILPSVHFTK